MNRIVPYGLYYTVKYLGIKNIVNEDLIKHIVKLMIVSMLLSL